MFVDIACSQMKKYNQNAYGDYFSSKRYQDEERLVAVMSDGLGSGIKANILSCMTATMLLKFISNDQIPINRAAEIVMNSLPVCKVRHISYATFSAIDCHDDGNVKIVEEGNPDFIWIRDGEVLVPDFEIIQSQTFPNRKMKIYKIKAQLCDRFVFCSDGVTQAGLGDGHLKLGMKREGLIALLKDKLKENTGISSSKLADFIVNKAKDIEINKEPQDDISACVLYFREPREAMVFTGPPYHRQKDKDYAQMFQSFKGKKAICGGTTANLVSRELNIPIRTDVIISVGNLPTISYMDGVDLVTEGILTLTKTLEYLENATVDIDNAAGKLVKFLLDSDCIQFLVGAKLNQAHYNPALPIEIEIRKNVIKKMAKVLQDKYFKKVNVQYI